MQCARRSPDNYGGVGARAFAATEGSGMSLDLTRWQFAFTSINHFLFVPIAIGLALMQHPVRVGDRLLARLG
jgi:hypothetical protein